MAVGTGEDPPQEDRGIVIPSCRGRIVEGGIETLHDYDLHHRFVQAYNAKYDWELAVRSDGEVKTLVPHAVFAWTDCGGETSGQGVPNAIGKWVFPSYD